MEIYSEKNFINKSIEVGIQSYLALKNGQHYSKMYRFEMIVIQILTIIYGENSILFPYKIDNETAFKCNLLIYDIKENEVKRFINLMEKYYDLMEDCKSEKMASGIIDELEKILIEMLKRRAKFKKYSSEEISLLDTIFSKHIDLNNFSKNEKNSSLIRQYWLDTKENLTNTQIEMISLNPDLLSREEYAKYGYDIRTIACLTTEEISSINNAIENAKAEKKYMKKPKFLEKYNLVLTTGNGFVDKLMLASIVATELMIGIIILAQLGGK